MEPVKKSFADMEEEANRNLNQFAFLLFIPNPMTKTIKYYVDGEKGTPYVKNKDDFISIIKSVCGSEEANRLEVACMEYGVPFLYDRTKKILRQMPEKPVGRKMDFSQKNAEDYLKEKQNQGDDLSSVFQDMLVNAGLY